ncbi:hypothetical protein chiPu_0016604, partial [Chiloscyllium punctatum]|nr:hypothetical protein [Chiloscyllium punctatum]
QGAGPCPGRQGAPTPRPQPQQGAGPCPGRQFVPLPEVQPPRGVCPQPSRQFVPPPGAQLPPSVYLQQIQQFMPPPGLQPPRGVCPQPSRPFMPPPGLQPPQGVCPRLNQPFVAPPHPQPPRGVCPQPSQQFVVPPCPQPPRGVCPQPSQQFVVPPCPQPPQGVCPQPSQQPVAPPCPQPRQGICPPAASQLLPLPHPEPCELPAVLISKRMGSSCTMPRRKPSAKEETGCRIYDFVCFKFQRWPLHLVLLQGSVENKYHQTGAIWVLLHLRSKMCVHLQNRWPMHLVLLQGGAENEYHQIGAIWGQLHLRSKTYVRLQMVLPQLRRDELQVTGPDMGAQQQGRRQGAEDTICRNLLGEIAFQLDRRVLTYVFTSGPRLYGFRVLNIPEKTIQVAACRGEHDQMTNRHNEIMQQLRNFGYCPNTHPKFAEHIVNTFGILKEKPQSPTMLAKYNDPEFLKQAIHANAPMNLVLDLMVLLNCLANMSANDGRPLFIW